MEVSGELYDPTAVRPGEEHQVPSILIINLLSYFFV
jgi:hypothetical protein